MTSKGSLALFAENIGFHKILQKAKEEFPQLDRRASRLRIAAHQFDEKVSETRILFIPINLTNMSTEN